jgi:hypothetical protein
MRKNRLKLEDRIKKYGVLEQQKAISTQIKSDNKYRSRIKKRVESMLDDKYTYFFTFTLDNDSIKLDEKNHIKKIKECLAGNISYLINNDYGDKTDRLHYHAIASFAYEYNTTFLNKYPFGFTSVKAIKQKNAKSLYEYILKLSNHTTKSSVAKLWRSRRRVIYYD